MVLKRITGILLALVMTVAIAGCGSKNSQTTNNSASSSAPAEKVKIRFINGFTGGDGGYMRKITDGFNKSQDKYEIEEVQDKDHYTKFKSDDYDLVVIHVNNLTTYVKDGLLREMDDIYEKAGIKISDFHPAAEKLVTRDGKKYAIPLDIHPLTMFYNKKLVSEAPKTYADLIKINENLQKKDKNLYALGIPSSGLVEFYMLTIAAQDGINLEKDGYLNFAQPEYAKSLMRFHDMIWKDKISPPGLGLDGEFQSFMKESKDNAAVQTAVALTGPWFYGAVKEKYGNDLGIGIIPVIGKKQAVYGNGHTIAVSAKVKDEKKLEAIAEFFKYMYKPENLINWADAGQAPLHKATMELVAQNKDKYPLAYYNQQQFDTFVQAPDVYQYGEQMRYMNETVFAKLVSTKDLTEEELMKELQKATDLAKQVSGS